MRKVKVYRCPICKKAYSSLTTWGNHMEKMHPNEIPRDYSYARYFYYLQTGKTHGNCIICKQQTEWNENTAKYERFCKNPKCKEKYRDIFKQRMIDRYGKVHLLNDPKKQVEMLKARKISGSYKFRDGTVVDYVGSYEKDFLVMMDTLLNFSGNDIMGPSPHTYEYKYANPKDKEHDGLKFYIPDFYIPSLNLEVEIKENTNMHHKILAIDKVKERLKDEVMKKNQHINYIKLVEKDYSPFFERLIKLKETIIIEDKKSKKKSPIIDNNTLESYMNIKENIASAYQPIIDILNANYNPDNDISLESATYDSTHKYPIFIVLMHSGTSLANTIKKVTGDAYSHACIAFNTKLDPLYSFGRKKLDVAETGFVANSPNHEFFKKYKASYSVMVMYLTRNEIEKMKKRLQFFIDNADKLKYDLIGLTRIYLNLKSSTEKRYFCSRFVADIINAGVGLSRNPSLYKPQDLGELDNIEEVASGDDFSKYRPSETERNLKKIRMR